MTTAATKPWLALMAVGGMVITTSLMASPAKALPTCVSGLPISTIASTGATGYSCTLGGLDYKFDSNVGSLDSTPSSVVNFFDSPTIQTITFANLDINYDLYFSYTILSPLESITDIVQTYVQNPSSPPPLPALTGITTTPALPAPPSPIAMVVQATYAFDTSMAPPDPTISSLTHTINKTPGPLPVAGAGLAFGFSRKLRRRIHERSRARSSM